MIQQGASEIIDYSALSEREIALAFLHHGFSGDTAQCLSMLSRDVAFRTLGDSTKIGISGRRDVSRLDRFYAAVSKVFPQGLKFDIVGVTAEGPRVAVEGRSEGTMANGFVYKNHYHFLIEVIDGSIAKVHEYFDTHYTFEIQQGSEPQPYDFI